jgi:hypothetical protein
MGYILYPDGKREEVTPANGTNFRLAELQKIVDGMIEIVPCKDERYILVINDEGKLLDFPKNEQATQLAYLATPADIARAKMHFGDALIIVGDDWKHEVPDYIVGTVLWCETEQAQ